MKVQSELQWEQNNKQVALLAAGKTVMSKLQ